MVPFLRLHGTASVADTTVHTADAGERPAGSSRTRRLGSEGRGYHRTVSRGLRLLGVPRLDDGAGGDVLPVTKPSSLLFYLACRNDWVGRHELAFMYVPDRPDGEALAYVRKLVFRARRYPWADGLEVRDASLRWIVESDLGTFRSALERRDWRAALEHFDGALLEGCTLSDVPGFEAWLELERELLEEQRTSAAVRHAEDLEERGFLEDAATWLSRVLARDPLDEQRLQSYLRVLRAAGQRQRALEAYDSFRETLRQDLEAEPLETTQALADEIRGGAGGRGSIEARPTDVRRHNLPAPTTRFVGRDRELDHLARCLARSDGRLVTLLGLGGIGKTRLAIECAGQHVHAFPDGVWVVPLEGATSAELLAPGIAGALGLVLDGSDTPEREVAEHLRDKETLLVLDGFEHLDEGVLVLETLLEVAPALKLLVTSRSALGLPSEWLVDVDGLASPPEHAKEALESFDAVRLFINRAERLSAGFAATDATLEAIARLCRRVDGMPLAIELAAAWTRSLAVPDLVARLERGFEPMATDDHEVADRHRSVHAVLDYTWNNLGDAERSVLAKLSVFVGGFTLEAAERVADAPLGRLLGLINHALVRRRAAGRFDLHELVRRYLEGHLDAEAEAQALGDLCDFYAGLMEARERTLKELDEKVALGELDADVDNLRRAWRYACEAGDRTQLARMAECYHFLLDTRGWYREGAEAFGSAAGRLDATDASAATDATGASTQQRATLGDLSARAGYFQFRLGRLGDARRTLEGSLELLSETPASATSGFAHHYLGVLDFLEGDNHGAQRRYRRALACYDPNDDAWLMSRTLNNLGVVADTLGDYDEALRWYDLALDSSKRIRHVRGVASALVNLGVTFETLGRLDEAEAHYRESLEAYREIGDVRGEAASLSNLGHLAEARGAFVDAKDFYEQSVALKRKLGDPVITAVCLTNLGDVRVALGQEGRAREAFAEALSLTRDAEALPYAFRVVWSYARLHAQRAEWSRALTLASFLAHRPESEAWLRREARAALEAWAADTTREVVADVVEHGRASSFTDVCASLDPSA
jgi:predicted ATPase/DNA-binding SARP family transcriptional activator/Tfp pilus assembly protein PilF